LDFYSSIIERKQIDITSKNDIRSKVPKLAWVVSSNLLLHPDYQFGVLSGLRYFTKIFDVYRIDEYTWLTNCTDMKWLSSFDVLISIVTLFDTLDASIQKLPRLYVEGKHVIQRRATFMIGFRMENDVKLNFEPCHYDVIWYRSPYEQRALESSGFKIPDIRLQHSFGSIESPDSVVTSDNVGEETRKLYRLIEPNKSEIHGNKEIESDNYIRRKKLSHAIICIFDHMSSCKSTERQEVEDTNTIILLLGGTLNAWISDDYFLGSTPLSRIILAGNYSTNFVISVLKVVQEVTVMHEFINDFRYLQSDALWPVVYPLTLGKKVYVKRSSQHIESIRGMGCEHWNERYMENSLKIGLARLFGLGVVSSKFRILVPRSNMTVTSKCVPMEIEFIDFEVGKDGKFCIVYESEDIICIIRPVAAITLHLSQENRLAKKLSGHIKLMFECRGNMFNDKIYTESFEFYLNIPEEEYSIQSGHSTCEDSSGEFCVDVPL